MRIIIITRFYKNGQTTHVTSLCTELMRIGHQVLLILTQFHDPAYARWLRQQEIMYLTTSNVHKLRAYLIRWKPTIIHNHSAHTLELSTELGKLLQIPSITTIHYLNFKPSPSLHQQNAVILISPEMKKAFSSLDLPTYMAENGVSIPKNDLTKKPWRQQALILAQINREKKTNFSEMTKSLLKWGWQVSSAGNWQYPGVKYYGWVNNVEPLLKQANLVVGTGRSIREAMAWSTPAWVLGTYSDGLVTPENVALLEKVNFSGRFSKKAFSESSATEYLEFPSPERFQALGNFGKTHALTNYSIHKMTTELVHIYGECLCKCLDENQT